MPRRSPSRSWQEKIFILLALLAVLSLILTSLLTTAPPPPPTPTPMGLFLPGP